MIFVDFRENDFGWFFATRIRIRFIEADSDPADQNETDPDLQHCFILSEKVLKQVSSFEIQIIFSTV